MSINLKTIAALVHSSLFDKHFSREKKAEGLQKEEKRNYYSTLRYSPLFYLLIEKNLKKFTKKSFLQEALCALMVLMEIKIFGNGQPFYLSALWKNYLKSKKINWFFLPSWAFLKDLEQDIFTQAEKLISETQCPKASMIKKILQNCPELSIKTLFSHPPLWAIIYKDCEDIQETVKKIGVLNKSNGLLQAVLLQSTLDPQYFTTGSIGYQNIATQYTAQIIKNIKDFSPEVVMDICASPGGKTLLLRTQWPKATLIATDLLSKKVEDLKKNYERVFQKDDKKTKFGIHDWSKEPLGTQADFLLCDLPCSGTGVTRKHPEIYWHKDKETLAALSQTQTNILLNALKSVKPGGYLLVATCSVLEEENSELIKNVLSLAKEEGREFHVQEIFGCQEAKPRELGLQFIPSAHFDGIYYCLLKNVPRGTF